MEKERNYVQCPACGTCVNCKKRNCDNPDCVVLNIHQAITEACENSRVSTEKKKEEKGCGQKTCHRSAHSEMFEDAGGTLTVGLKGKREVAAGCEDKAPPVKSEKG